MHDLETGQAQEIVVDDFILSDLQSPSVNNTAHNGPFHVLFYSPTDFFNSCYAVRDDWLSISSNQLVLEKFLAAIYQAQRYFISNPGQFVTFAEQQLPETPASEIQFASTFYPSHLAYWAYGLYNLEGNESLQVKYNNTNNFFITAGALKTPAANDSVQPYGVFNKYFELKALQMLGPFTYPDLAGSINNSNQIYKPGHRLGCLIPPLQQERGEGTNMASSKVIPRVGSSWSGNGNRISGGCDSPENISSAEGGSGQHPDQCRPQ